MRRIAAGRTISAAVALALTLLLPGVAHSEFWKNRDWKDHNHKLKVCLKSDGCPANMADSVKAAIGLWNARNLTWTFTFVNDCTGADVTISCADLGDETLGQTETEAPTTTSADVTINNSPDAGFGWCDDKSEIVSSICHELGHCARLKDAPDVDQGKVMRGTQKTPGHLRGPSNADADEAATSDTAGVLSAVTNPPGKQKQSIYQGIMTPATGTAPFDFDRTIGAQLQAFQPQYLQILGATPLDNNSLQWTANLNPPSADMLLYFLVLEYPESTSVRQGVLHVTDFTWQAGWAPHPIASNDTTVPTNRSSVYLDYSNSSHPAGQVVSYQWILDGTSVLQAEGPRAIAHFPAGDHLVELDAEDQFGIERRDTMIVHVLMNVGVSEGVVEARLRLAFQVPVHRGRVVPISFELPRQARVSMVVYDVQGREIRRLISDATLETGGHVTSWDLRDASGRSLPAGTYLVSLRAGDTRVVHKLLLLP